MRSFPSLLVAVFLLLCLQPSLGQSSNYSNKPRIYAVVVGVSDYKDEEIPNLKFAEKDAFSFYEFLKSPNSGSVPEENIALLVGSKASRANIIREVIDKFTRSTKDDLIIFYFSGHGKGGEFDNSGYLMSYDAENNNEGATALSMEEIKGKIDKCQAKMKVSYVDACHAGLFKSNNTKGTSIEDNAIIATAYMDGLSKAGDGNVAFLASTARQQSLEDEKLGNGVFTYHLIKGLKGEADKEQQGAPGFNDGIVTAGELATYLTNKIQLATKFKQKPTIDGIYDDAFPLSILKSDVSITNEISKRPEKKPKPAANSVSPNVIVKVPEDQKLADVVTYLNGTCYGTYDFINQFNEPLLLYKYRGWYSTQEVSLIIPPGHAINTGRLWAGLESNASNCNQVYDYFFSFKTIRESPSPRFGYIKVQVQAGRKKSYIINEQNLYLSNKEFIY